MPHDFPVPATERLELLLEQAFAAMPHAEPARLKRLEERLVRRAPAGTRQKKPNRIPWWIVLLLAGGFASAAWWAGEKWFKDKPAIPIDKEIQPSESDKVFDHELETGPGSTEQTEEQPGQDEGESPVIYLRESY